MKTRKCKVELSLFNRIDILNRNAIEVPAAKQVFRVVGVILARVRDKMIDNKDSVQLCEDLFNTCEALKNAIQGKDVDDLDDPIRAALEDLDSLVFEIERTLRRGPNSPYTKYDKEKIEGHKLDIRQILGILSTLSTPLHGESVVQSTNPVAPGRSSSTTAAPTAGNAVCRLIQRVFSLSDRSSLIESVFSTKDGSNMVRDLGEDDAQSFIDVIDEALMDAPDLPPLIRKKCLKSLYRTCGRHAFLPTAMKTLVQYDRMGSALYRGGFADVWKGKHCGREVAVKVIRTYTSGDLQKVIGRFCKEVVIWRNLRHPNILRLIGVTMTKTQFAMVSDWMENGNINEFVKANPDTNRLELLGDVARGLIYIHSQGMIHGDLKGANILIDHDGHARLADFGLLTIISDPTNILSSSSYAQGGTARWMSPELIDPQKFGLEISRPTKSSDCYALGMVIYETISRKPPFYNHTDLTVFVKVLEGKRPSREVGFTDGLWKMLELCWMPQPDCRPCTENVLQCLERVAQSSGPPSEVNGEVGSPSISVPCSGDTGFCDQTVITRPLHKSPERSIMERLFSDLEQHPLSWAFLRPVDPEEVPDYYEVIKDPMDFKTMERKLETNQYPNLDAFVDDAILVFDNCYAYNSDRSIFTLNAMKLEKFMKGRLAMYRAGRGGC